MRDNVVLLEVFKQLLESNLLGVVNIIEYLRTRLMGKMIFKVPSNTSVIL